MAFRSTSEYRRAWESLKKHSLLAASDQVLPSVTTLVAGEPVSGSWWSHPRAHDIYAVMEQLSAHPDVLTIKLLSGKITFAHRTLWPAIVAVAAAHEPWQVRGLPHAAVSLLRRVRAEGRIDAEEALRLRGGSARPARAAIDVLEARLLVHTEQEHTRGGAHARALESWEHWTGRVGFSGPQLTPRLGIERILAAVRPMCAETGGKCRLPWE